MNESKHTPGPWERSSGGIWVKSPWNARVCIANMTKISPMNGIDQEANGRLIAVAPDMLATLESWCEWHYQRYGDKPDSSPITETVAAIAKATETP